MSDHHPPHIYLDETWYMITSSVYQKHRYLSTNGYKDCVRDPLKTLIIKFGIHLTAWVILDNHYHILVKSKTGAAIPSFIGRLHGRSSFDINAMDNRRGRQVWHNYWDTCIRTEADYWTRFNYIHHNPVKHGYVDKMESWPFTSYQYYLEHKGEAWLMDAFYRYPIIDFSGPDDDF
jgi:putative transposase